MGICGESTRTRSDCTNGHGEVRRFCFYEARAVLNTHTLRDDHAPLGGFQKDQPKCQKSNVSTNINETVRDPENKQLLVVSFREKYKTRLLDDAEAVSCSFHTAISRFRMLRASIRGHTKQYQDAKAAPKLQFEWKNKEEGGPW